MRPISNPYIRDTITIDGAFSDYLNTFAGDGPIYLLARIVDQQAELRVGVLSVVIVADELRGNGHLINAVGPRSEAVGPRGEDADPTPALHEGNPGGDGGAGEAGKGGGTVTVMCRRSSGVRIDTSGGSGAAGGAGGNGGPGSPATSTPGGTTTVTKFDADGNPFEEEEQLPDIETPGTRGGLGGFGGAGGAGGHAGAIRFTSIVDDTVPVLQANGGVGGPGGAGGVAGPHGTHAEIPPDLDTTPAPGAPGAPGSPGSVSVLTVSEEEYVAALRPLLDAGGPSFADLWAAHRLKVGQYFYRQFRRSDPDKGADGATEFARVLELRPDDGEAVRWQRQLLEVPRPLSEGMAVTWHPGGLNALGLPRNIDVLPRFEAYRDAFASFGDLVIDFLQSGTTVLLGQHDVNLWRSHLALLRTQALAAQETTLEDRGDAETEARLASEAIAGVQRRLDQTTRDIQEALAAMREEPLTLLGFVGTIFGVAAAVVAVIAAVPSFGASLVALAPTMVALSSSVIDNAEPIAKALLAGDEVKTDEIKNAYKKVDTAAGDVVKGAKAIVSFVDVVKKLTEVTTDDNSRHLDLVRHGVELTHELLLANHRVTLAQQRLGAAHARVGRAEAAVAGIDAVVAGLAPTEEALRSTGLHAIAIAESKADALLTLAFYAQRSVEIYTLTDQEEEVRLESGHLHPDHRRRYDEGETGEQGEIVLVGLLNDSWAGLLGLLELQVEFNRFTTQFHDKDKRRLSFGADGPELEALRAAGRFAFRIDAATLPPGHADAKVRSVQVALVGATHPAGEVTCAVRHGSSYETRRHDGTVHVSLLQPRSSNRDATLVRLEAEGGGGPDPLLTEPQSLSFWGRGIGGDWELSIPGHEFQAGLDLSGLTEVQVWIGYTFLPGLQPV